MKLNMGGILDFDRAPEFVKSLSMLRYYQEGERIPLGYGYAWREVNRDVVVLMPIPLNIIAQYVRWLWYTSMHPMVIDALDAAEALVKAVLK